jgi:hypothetical protein
MTESWTAIATPWLDMEMPPTWDRLQSDDDRVVAIANSSTPDEGFRANVVAVVGGAAETRGQRGARSIVEGLVYPGWSHVVSDSEWRRPDATGRVVNFIHETSGRCIAVTHSALVTGSHALEVTASCDIVDRLRFEDLFNTIARTARVAVQS